jgi:endogenous inhibitor of DNA gyrase (YacG/DUF329 family)
MKICEYCESKFEGRENKLFCSENCRKYYNKWAKGKPRTPYNRVLSEEEILLKEKANRLSSVNSTADCVSEKIKLDHFDIISNSDRRYLGFPRKKGT